jgi:hypothetical protein
MQFVPGLSIVLSNALIQELKRSKKEKMKDIIKAMEAFNENLVGGKRLVKALEKDTVSWNARLC